MPLYTVTCQQTLDEEFCQRNTIKIQTSILEVISSTASFYTWGTKTTDEIMVIYQGQNANANFYFAFYFHLVLCPLLKEARNFGN